MPDILTMAKGLTSAYVALGAVGIRRKIADHFKDKVFYGGLTYNSHPLGCAAALATIAVYEEDQLIERARKMGVVMKQMHAGAEGEASVGRRRPLDRPLRDRRAGEETARPWSRWRRSTARSPEMQALGKFFREEGLYTFVRWNGFFTNPPLTHHRGGDGGSVRDHRQGSRHHRQGGRVTDVFCCSARRASRAAACCAPASTRRR